MVIRITFYLFLILITGCQKKDLSGNLLPIGKYRIGQSLCSQGASYEVDLINGTIKGSRQEGIYNNSIRRLSCATASRLKISRVDEPKKIDEGNRLALFNALSGLRIEKYGTGDKCKENPNKFTWSPVYLFREDTQEQYSTAQYDCLALFISDDNPFWDLLENAFNSVGPVVSESQEVSD